MGNPVVLKKHGELVRFLASVSESVELEDNEVKNLEIFVSNNVRMIEIVRDGYKGLGLNSVARSINDLITKRNTIKEKSRYLCYWDKEAFSVGGTKEVDIDFFSEVNAYETNETEAISNLVVGETWKSSDFGDAHTVKRIS